MGQIAAQLRRSKSSISRELARLGPGDYDHTLAHAMAGKLAAVARRPKNRSESLLLKIEESLELGWSPQQITGRARQEGRNDVPSHETIYQIIAEDRITGGSLYELLPCAGKKYRSDRNGTKRGHRLNVKAEQDIDQRPARINDRGEYGHWEADLMQTKNGDVHLLVAVERRTLEVRLCALPSKEAKPMGVALERILRGCHVLSVTFDRGLEWMEASATLAGIGAVCYFCKPYHSWEKGTVENTNRLLRRYLPKWMVVAHEEMLPGEVLHMENELNDRPRAVLGYATPHEAAALCRQGKTTERKIYQRKVRGSVNKGCVSVETKAA